MKKNLTIEAIGRSIFYLLENLTIVAIGRGIFFIYWEIFTMGERMKEKKLLFATLIIIEIIL